MLDAIEKLLILQDRDRKVLLLHAELNALEPQRRMIQSKAATAQSALESAKLRGRHLEADRKKLELEVETQKQHIERYSLQQYQTKKNEEYRALAHEIQLAREAIVKLEDQQLELMEQAEAVQKEIRAAGESQNEAHQTSQKQAADLAEREATLRQQLEQVEADRDRLTAGIEPDVLLRYERLRKSKGEKVVVGVAHGVCGGCHMRLPAQTLVSCQAEHELVTCINCGRILYYTRDMSLVTAD
jgi:hypothetical protein